MDQSNLSSSEKIDYRTVDRVVKDVPVILKKRATIAEIYDTDHLPKLDFVKELFHNEGRFDDSAIIKVLEDVEEILKKEPNLLKIDQNAIICGDVHGQFFDLLKLFELGGDPANNKYLFLGDYVDRGSFSTECLLYLYCHKIRYPNTFFMLRGNHECRHLTEYFTFRNECKVKYSMEMYEHFCDSFNTLPLAAVVNKQFLCIHGGLSPEIIKLKDIERINRFSEPPSSGPFCDILWSDPHESFGNEKSDFGFVVNNVRGCSYYFSYLACCDFISRNNLLSVIRAHEAQDAGYKMYKPAQSSGFPALITLNIVTEMLGHVLNVCSLEDFDNEEAMTSDRREIIKNKVLAVGRMAQVFTILREESFNVIKLKGLTPNGTLPAGLLSGGKDSLLSALEHFSADGQLVANFDEARQLDLINERCPPRIEPEN
ncbi:hypothetical protein HZS_1725, partial [Henneguya salminicola]